MELSFSKERDTREGLARELEVLTLNLTPTMTSSRPASTRTPDTNPTLPGYSSRALLRL